jgi:hypothetical protein
MSVHWLWIIVQTVTDIYTFMKEVHFWIEDNNCNIPRKIYNFWIGALLSGNISTLIFLFYISYTCKWQGNCFDLCNVGSCIQLDWLCEWIELYTILLGCFWLHGPVGWSRISSDCFLWHHVVDEIWWSYCEHDCLFHINNDLGVTFCSGRGNNCLASNVSLRL